jgi:hypothetical protein
MDASLERRLLSNSTLRVPIKTEAKPLPLVQRKMKSEIPPSDMSEYVSGSVVSTGC